MIRILINLTCILSAMGRENLPKQQPHDLYRRGHQFPQGSGHMKLPPILFLSIYMGKVKYNHMSLLFESMKWNPMVDFTLINVVSAQSDTDEIKGLMKKTAVTNFFLKDISIEEFRHRVYKKLHIDVPFTLDWYYKMCDYKPTLAYLFPELLTTAVTRDQQNNTGASSIPQTYVYWAYGDLDVIWGNISRFAHWFQVKNQPFVVSDYTGASGQACFYINEAWTYSLFKSDAMYIPLLQNISYHNLDESGFGTRKEFIIDEGEHSMARILERYIDQNSTGIKLNSLRKGRAYEEEFESIEWAGPALWFRGTVKLIHGSQRQPNHKNRHTFPAGHELMFYHRPHPRFQFPEKVKDEIIEDMKMYGYLLPYWIPLLTRHKCRSAGINKHNDATQLADYRPYDPTCFPPKHNNSNKKSR